MMATWLNSEWLFSSIFFYLTYLTKKVRYLQQNTLHVLPPKKNPQTRCPTVALLDCGAFFLHI